MITLSHDDGDELQLVRLKRFHIELTARTPFDSKFVDIFFQEVRRSIDLGLSQDGSFTSFVFIRCH